MNLNDFIKYLDNSKKNLILNKKNENYGHLVDNYCIKIDKIKKNLLN